MNVWSGSKVRVRPVEELPLESPARVKGS